MITSNLIPKKIISQPNWLENSKLQPIWLYKHNLLSYIDINNSNRVDAKKNKQISGEKQ
jgi:hypothetical protein